MDYPREITIEEMPQGCILSTPTDEIVVASPTDALAIIASLQDLIRVQYPKLYCTPDLEKVFAFVRGVFGANKQLADATLKEMGLIQ